MTEQQTAQLQNLARELEHLASSYTRMMGPNGNGDRVADLLSGDAHAISKRMKIVLGGGDDPGDDRYTCWQISCGKFKGHYGDHD